MASRSGSATLTREELESEVDDETLIAQTQAESAESSATEQSVDEQPGAEYDEDDLPELSNEVLAKYLQKADTKWLATHPKVAGLTGDLANRRAQTLTQQREAQLRAELEQEIRERYQRTQDEELLERDPEAYRETYFERRQREESEAQAQQEQQQVLAAYDQNIIEPTLLSAAPEVQAKFRGKHYPGNPLEARATFMKELQAEIMNFEQQRVRAEFESSAAEAIKKDALTYRNTQQRPNLTNTRAPKRTYTAEDVKGMSLEEYEEKQDEIEAQIAGKRK